MYWAGAESIQAVDAKNAKAIRNSKGAVDKGAVELARAEKRGARRALQNSRFLFCVFCGPFASFASESKTVNPT
jgi:hypothetical protein